MISERTLVDVGNRGWAQGHVKEKLEHVSSRGSVNQY
tara:strand:- start:579 stop:689 length:111 start_codon:yes stop_codon:yes gene_type:complete